jgi:hypothetical protein
MTKDGSFKSSHLAHAALSREAGQFGDSLVEGVGDALAEQSPEHLVARGGAVADAVGVGLDARLDHIGAGWGGPFGSLDFT